MIGEARVIVHCSTRKEAEALMEMVKHSRAFEHSAQWDGYREETCYRISGDCIYTRGRLKWYKANMPDTPIVTFAEFANGKTKPTPKDPRIVTVQRGDLLLDLTNQTIDGQSVEELRKEISERRSKLGKFERERIRCAAIL